MTTANPHTETPGYVAGTWAIDPIHSDVSFTVRHMMVSKVRGRFSKFAGTILRIRRERQLPMEQAAEAHRLLDSGDTQEKLILETR